MIRAREDRWFARFCRTGDPGALAKVFDRTHAELWRVATYLCRDRHMAEDCVQSAFLAAIESRDQWDPLRPLMPWLLGLLANRVREHRRRAQRAVDPDRLPMVRQASPTERAEDSEFHEAFVQALGRVPEPHRTALERHLVHCIPAHEVAAELGVSAGTLRMRLHRGLEHLRQRLPQGLAPASVVVVRLPEAAAGAMRARILEEASKAAPLAAGSVPWITFALGAIAMKKIVLSVSLAGAVLLAVALAPSLAAPDVAARAPQPPASVLAAETTQDADGHEPTRRVAAAAAVAEPAAQELPVGFGEVRVILRDAVTNATVPGANIQLQPVGSDGDAAGATQRNGARGRTRIALTSTATQRTDAEGRARMLSRQGRYAVAAPELSGVEEVVIEVVAGTAQEVELTAHPQLALKIRVLRPDGQPAAGAEIVGWTSLDESQAFVQGPPFLCVERPLGICDGNGQFTSGLIAAKARVRALAPGLAASASVELSENNARATLRLGAAAATIAGVVLAADGSPSPHAHVWVQHSAAGASGEIRSRAGADGRFRIEGVPAGPCRVFAVVSLDADFMSAFKGNRFSWAAVETAAGQQAQVDLSFVNSARLQVQVTDAQGKPSSDQQVSVVFMDETLPSELAASCIARGNTDDLGRVEIEGLPAGRHEAQVWVDGEGLRHKLDLAAGELATWTPSLAPTEALRLEVVDQAGKPLAGWFVTAVPAAGGIAREVRTDAEGRARFDELPRGEYQVEVRATAKALSSAQAVCFTDRSERIVIEASQMPTSAVEGRVVGSGEELGGLVVEIGAMGRDGSGAFEFLATANVDPDTGRFAFEGLPAGEFAAVVMRKDAAARTALAMKTAIRVAASQRVDVGDLLLGAGSSSLRIDLVREDGAAILQPLILGRLAEQAEAPFRRGPVQMQGQACVLTDVPPAELELLAWGENAAPKRLRLRGGSGQSTTTMRLLPAVPVTMELHGLESGAACTLRIALADGESFAEAYRGESSLRRGFPPGRHHVSVEDRAGRRAAADVVVTGQGAPLVRLELR